uniref:cancer-related nucleoside-triphosphatase isoform X2 n=1 Tax=Nyctereutes procyonoides TaxID=34880 RepID=UPI002444D6CD|nr:cancer-related nucleoside-triphosphatase isoform X2 [Nyctereutes procyonoides]
MRERGRRGGTGADRGGALRRMRGRRRRGLGHAAGRNPDVTQTATQTATPAGAPPPPPTRAQGHGPPRVPDGVPRAEPPPGKRECRVGQYVVDLTSFELLALPVLRNAGSSSGPGQRVCVIDEIGKMELFSQPFIQAVRQMLSTPGTVVLGTIPIPKGKPLALVEEIRNRNDVQVFNFLFCLWNQGTASSLSVWDTRCCPCPDTLRSWRRGECRLGGSPTALTAEEACLTVWSPGS